MTFGECAERTGPGLRGLNGKAVEVIEIGAVWTLEVFFFVVDVFAEAETVQELEVYDIGLLRHSLYFV